METVLACSLLLAGLWLLTPSPTASTAATPSAFTAEPTVGLALLALAALTRLELAVFAFGVALVLIVTRRANPITFALAAFAAALGALWTWLQFGTLVPNTVTAKALAYYEPITKDLSAFGMSLRLLPILVLILALFLWRLIGERNHAPIPLAPALLLLWGVFLAALYCLRHAWLASWYLPLVLLPFTLGAWLLISPRNSLLTRSLAVILTLWLLQLPIYTSRHLIAESIFGLDYPRWNDEYASPARVHEYLAVGTALDHACPQGTLLTSEIGGLGYGFRGTVLDGMGLITLAAIAFHPLHMPEDSPSGDQGAIPPRYAQAAHADLIATYLHHGETVVRLASSLGYTDISLPPFLPSDHILHPEHSHFGDMHVLVRNDGACKLDAVKDALFQAALLQP